MSARRTVLLVEDDPEIRGLLADVLVEEDYAVATAANGSEALELLGRGDPPDAIILDVMMPVMDGEEFRRRQLADDRLSAIPVVLLTANRDAPGKAGLASVAATLVKPARLGELLNVLDRVIAPTTA